MNDPARKWMRPKLSDYWDWKTNAIERGAEALADLTEPKRGMALGEISRDVAGHATALTDRWVVMTAWMAVEDLYKVANTIGWWDRDLYDYIRASAGTLMRVAK